VSITDRALVAAATLADRSINDRFLPDQARDLIDEAGARLRIRRMTAPPELKVLDEEIAEARREKESAIDEQDFEKAAGLRDKEKQLTAKRADRERAWKSGDLDTVATVDEELVAEVLAMSTGIPVVKLTEEESGRLLRMEEELHKRVVGQEAAIKALSQAIRRTRAGLKDPKRPGGSFIFAGPTGVGKTELAKALAEFLFGDEDALIQLDMSEFSEKHTVSRLFGSPPGYVGYDEGGQLTEKVRRKPFSVVLFDEVEKAHADIFNSLLQVLEDGRLTDSQGRVVDFKNTVIIMTTNLGTRDIAKGVQTGFQAGGDLVTSYERMKAKVNEELKQHFRPEFLNRVDDVVVFPQLSQKEIVEIVDLEIAKLDKRLRDKDMAIELTPAAKQLLAEKGYDPVLGARPLKRAIQREIEDTLSEKILFGDIKAGELIVVDGQGEGILGEFTFEGKPKPEGKEPVTVGARSGTDVPRSGPSDAPPTGELRAGA
jgi:ATP-dependent Clp protease ATP-binding subunit ClpC